MIQVILELQATRKGEGFAPYVNHLVAKKSELSKPPYIEVFRQKSTLTSDLFVLENMVNSVLKTDKSQAEVEWLWLQDGQVVIILIHNPSPYIKFKFVEQNCNLGVMVEYTDPPY